MEEEKLNNNSENFQNFIRLQEQLLESYSIGSNVPKSVLELDELFMFFNEHFKEFYNKDNFPVVLAFIHRCLKNAIGRKDYSDDDIGILLVNLLAEHNENEVDINIVVQIIYQVMHSIKYLGLKDVLISEKILHEIISIVPNIKSLTLVSKCTACIQKYIEMFPQSKKNLETLWFCIKHQIQCNLNNGVIKDTEIHILIQLIDEFKLFQHNFHEEPLLMNTIQHLIKSDQKRNRKCGHFLLRKLSQFAVENVNTLVGVWLSSDHIQQIQISWAVYITMLENLEEEQSHLILPSLENLEELIKTKQLPSFWLNILYIRILNHKNNLVVRWFIEFFLKTFSCSDLSTELLKSLLHATNSNLLFNYEGYFLKKEYISSFVKEDVENLLSLFNEIDNWKSVPLYMWMECLAEKPLLLPLSFETVLNICSCVRKLQNCVIREKAQSKCEVIFKDFKQKMSIKEYVTYIETLYNVRDKYVEHDLFFSKKSSFNTTEPTDSLFNQRFYEIFTNNKWDNTALLQFLDDIPVEQHGWLKFAPFKLQISEPHYHLIHKLYKLDLALLRDLNLFDIMSNFSNTFLGSPPYDKYEHIECNQAAISFYILMNNINIEDARFVLDTGINNDQVLTTFAKKLLSENQQKIDLWFIDELLKYNCKDLIEPICHYFNNVYDDCEDVIKKKFISVFLKSTFLYSRFWKDINKSKLLAEHWFEVSASQGDKRIEEAFCFNHLKIKHINQISALDLFYNSDKQTVLDLLKYHTDITKKKPRYFENSNEHRIKLRVVIYIFCSMKCTIKGNDCADVLDQIWDILVNEKNQLNVIYFYEFILGSREYRPNVIWNKLELAQNMTSSQQISIISVAYINFQNNIISTEEAENKMIYYLLPLTMGAHFQVRLFSQMCLYQLLQNKFERNEERQRIIKSIEIVFGDKLTEYLTDIRLHLMDLSKKFSLVHIILYVTNVPFDELLHLRIDNLVSVLEGLGQIEPFRKRHLNKYKIKNNVDTTATGTMNSQIQRKVNPINDVMEPHNLIIYPVEKKSAKMFVVASLIDKLPNLGGIARTCEVLGIKNLVMDSKMHLQKNDFKNLSMTAETTLNIFEVKPTDIKEFLIKKKLEGYNIVGAEQTSGSETFNNFKFPEKCVLLLGHEKDGIPPPLLGLLDNAVEIPQFGQVRSLNVHVTGALFMWEYCKQHLL